MSGARLKKVARGMLPARLEKSSNRSIQRGCTYTSNGRQAVGVHFNTLQTESDNASLEPLPTNVSQRNKLAEHAQLAIISLTDSQKEQTLCTFNCAPRTLRHMLH